MSETVIESRVAKSQRINLRATERQEAVLRRAAEATDRSLTEFVMSSAVDEAHRVLADRRWFSATEAQFDEFVRLLDEPLPSTSKFDRLFARPSHLAEGE
ncbi:DUF1778 domain-containing protein [Microbacterium sp. KUDC0406]|uniref:type II toxin-antitoxin system TacA family antitoxin n=1 Tax=Microbacterium sp. KUDC0406 TaxID=2909588 RepID=UPI001F43797E|nr:DUF1778 domain-containing protein [Microbacterium sp. KUDC0406]UJP09393.1 DUF1778 domain-containing protein [Microbacterium sp. KUDC0406]